MHPRRSDDHELSRRCRMLVRQLEETVGVPSPFELTAFLERLSGHRQGRPITLLPLPAGELPAGACGLWLALGDSDVIGFPEGLPLHHRDHIVLHEVGHIIAGHHGAVPAGHMLPELLPDLDPEMVRSVLGRSVYTRVEEREAELIASLVMQRALDGAAAPPAGDAVMDRLIRTLGAG
jgi:hypothetical protein